MQGQQNNTINRKPRLCTGTSASANPASIPMIPWKGKPSVQKQKPNELGNGRGDA
ncbi:arginine deiminase [Anopheles sinensis]|uniref:Arginine deiminase n=1 Tax=Anopheles sinensis TaxID=74873 RepID=A0A084VG59_ANOSI|nr:arginine deiminase [Anopheles sinensis]